MQNSNFIVFFSEKSFAEEGGGGGEEGEKVGELATLLGATYEKMVERKKELEEWAERGEEEQGEEGEGVEEG